MKKKVQGHTVTKVVEGSIAEEMEIMPGDVLLEINGEPLEDVFDYRFLIRDEYIEVLVRKPWGEEWLLEIDKEYEEDLGLEFENGLMSEYRSCNNHCIFCFIDQMPKGMRKTLYFKDDDSRLSFLQGSYITLTNMSDRDVDRIIRFHLGPINISIHATDPALRCRMLHNRFAGKLFSYMDRLYEGQIEMNGQIVLCKKVNDGEELRRSIRDLSRYLPFLRSVSVVPAGITKFREGLFPLEAFTQEEAGAVIDLVEAFQREFFPKYGLHFVHASDEFYLLAKRPFPEEERYDGYIQLENGVGMMRLFTEEFQEALQNPPPRKAVPPRHISIATGKLAYPMICSAARQVMERFPQIRIQVFCIRNDFFGESITAAGLVTGQDLVAQLLEASALGTHLYIPACMLRTGEAVFLDDWTVADVEAALGLSVEAVDAGGGDFLAAMLDPAYHMSRNNERAGYIAAYDTANDNK